MKKVAAGISAKSSEIFSKLNNAKRHSNRLKILDNQLMAGDNRCLWGWRVTIRLGIIRL